MSQQSISDVTCAHGCECACAECRDMSHKGFELAEYWLAKYLELVDENKRLRGMQEGETFGGCMPDVSKEGEGS